MSGLGLFELPRPDAIPPELLLQLDRAPSLEAVYAREFVPAPFPGGRLVAFAVFSLGRWAPCE